MHSLCHHLQFKKKSGKDSFCIDSLITKYCRDCKRLIRLIYCHFFPLVVIFPLRNCRNISIRSSHVLLSISKLLSLTSLNLLSKRLEHFLDLFFLTNFYFLFCFIFWLLSNKTVDDLSHFGN